MKAMGLEGRELCRDDRDGGDRTRVIKAMGLDCREL